jgi:hypothetical protein
LPNQRHKCLGGLSWERIGWQHRLAAEGGSIGRAAASVGRQHRLGSSRPLLPTDAAAQPMLPVERQSGIEGSRVRQRVKKCSRGQLQGIVGRKRAAQEGGSSGRCKRVAASVGRGGGSRGGSTGGSRGRQQRVAPSVGSRGGSRGRQLCCWFLHVLGRDHIERASSQAETTTRFPIQLAVTGYRYDILYNQTQSVPVCVLRRQFEN